MSEGGGWPPRGGHHGALHLTEEVPASAACRMETDGQLVPDQGSPAAVATAAVATTAVDTTTGLQQQVMLLHQSNTTAHMDTDQQQDLGQLYNQGRQARAASQEVKLTTVGAAVQGLTYRTEKASCSLTGGFNLDPETKKTFHGSRINKGLNKVYENYSASFDPANMSCIMCRGEHSVLGSMEPMTLCLSDQHFPTNLSGVGGGRKKRQLHCSGKIGGCQHL